MYNSFEPNLFRNKTASNKHMRVALEQSNRLACNIRKCTLATDCVQVYPPISKNLTIVSSKTMDYFSHAN